MLLWMWLLGCQPLNVAVEQIACEDVDLDGEPEILFVEDGGDLLMRRTLSFRGDFDTFSPTVDSAGKSFQVREAWETSPDSTNELCWFPQLRVLDAPPGHYRVEWFEDEDGIPLGIAEYDL